MKDNIAIKVESLSKSYRIGLKDELHDTILDSFASWVKTPLSNFKGLKKLSKISHSSNDEDIIKVLNNISFEVKHGEVLGVIGENGAGKSTLLKILCRVTPPTSGRITINGRVASLLEVGTGFHQELTGRENIYLNGTILGMKKAEIDRKFDEIIDFSGVEKFLDTPVKRYSSGMKVRLAFSVAAHLEPEILLIDEVLAVGDLSFQNKCMNKMDDIASEGRTIIFVSHQMEAVSNLCSNAILLRDGSIAEAGNTEAVVSAYIKEQTDTASIPLNSRVDRHGDGRIRFTKTWVENEEGAKVSSLRTGDFMKLVATYEVQNGSNINELIVSFVISSIKNIQISDLKNVVAGVPFSGQIPKSGKVECVIPKLPLNKGNYFYNVYMRSRLGVEDHVMHAGKFSIETGDYFGTGKLPEKGLVMIEHGWTLKEDQPRNQYNNYK